MIKKLTGAQLFNLKGEKIGVVGKPKGDGSYEVKKPRKKYKKFFKS